MLDSQNVLIYQTNIEAGKKVCTVCWMIDMTLFSGYNFPPSAFLAGLSGPQMTLRSYVAKTNIENNTTASTNSRTYLFIFQIYFPVLGPIKLYSVKNKLILRSDTNLCHCNVRSSASTFTSKNRLYQVLYLLIDVRD